MTDPDRTETQNILRNAVASAVMAPSSHNTQPWRFRIVGSKLEILADSRRHLAVIDRERRQLVMSCGCALFNARVAVRAMGYMDRVTVNVMDGARIDLVATLELGSRIVPTAWDLALMRAIPLRRTNRRPFLPEPVAATVSAALEESAALQAAWMVRLVPDQKRALGRMIDEADRLQYADPAFRHEMGSWLTPFASRRADGIPFVEKEYGSALPFTLMRALRSPGLGDELGQLEQELVLGAPVVAVLGTGEDTPVDWLACGQALEAVLLHSTHLGLSAAFLNQVLEIPESRGRVTGVVGRPGYPQMVVRLGYAAQPVHHAAPRRSLDDVLLVVE